MIDISWNPSAKDLRGFGWVMLIGFGLIGMAKAFWPFEWGLVQHRQIGIWIILLSLAIGIPGILGWRIAVPFYRAWMGVSWVVSKVMFPFTFALFYYLIVSPIGFALRVAGKDALALKKRKTDSYWITLSQVEGVEEYERQY